jgi:hypothetical protein
MNDLQGVVGNASLARFEDLPTSQLGLLQVPTGHCYRGTAQGQDARRFETDPGTGAGHDGMLAAEIDPCGYLFGRR